MIIKSFEINKINIKINQFILFYGKNEGLKNEALNNLCITIMDGEYVSLYPRDNNLYTLSSVKYTPLITYEDFVDFQTHGEKFIEGLNKKIYKINHFKYSFIKSIITFYSLIKQ